MAGKFVLKRGTTGKFRFNLLSSNGKVIATSEAYETKAAAMNGIESVRKNAGGASVDDQTQQSSGQRTKGKSSGGKGKVERALKRDWEQTKSDMPGLKGKDLKQDVTDTVRQAAGEQRVPARNRQN